MKIFFYVQENQFLGPFLNTRTHLHVFDISFLFKLENMENSFNTCLLLGFLPLVQKKILILFLSKIQKH